MASGTFEYMQVITVGAQLDVDDIGDCAILARDDLGQEYYLVITTYMGQTEIIEYGPCIPDIQLLPKSVSYKYYRIDYSEFRIEKAIDKFLNSNPVTFAEVTDMETIKPLIKSMIEHVRQ